MTILGTTTLAGAGSGVANSRQSVWSAVTGAGLWYAVYNDGAAWKWQTSADAVTWGAATTVPGLAFGSSDPRASNLTSDSAGNLYLTVYNGGSGHVLYSSFTAAGWLATPTDIAQTFAGSTLSIAETGGHVYVRQIGVSSGGGTLQHITDPTPTNTTFANDYTLSGSAGSSINSQTAWVLESVGANVIVGWVNTATTPGLDFVSLPSAPPGSVVFGTASTNVLSVAGLQTDLTSAVDGAGLLHVVYRVAGTGWLEATYNGTAWTTGLALTGIADTDRSPSLVKDAAGTLHLYYTKFNATSDYGIGHVSKASGGAWTAQTDLVAHNAVNRQFVEAARLPHSGGTVVSWTEGTASPYNFVAALASLGAAAATAFTLTGPASGTTGAASTAFTVTPNGALGQAETIALTDSGAGGTFAPTSLSFANAATAAQTFTYTPASVGAKTLTATPSPALGTAPTATYTSNASAATVSGVTVSPSAPTVAGAATQQFTATVAGTGSPAQTVTWAATLGTITSGGLYTAPASTSSAQTATITATSTVDNTKSGTATSAIPATPAAGASPPSIQVTQPTGCRPGEGESAYLSIATAMGATDADVLPVVTYALHNQAGDSALAPTVTRVAKGIYRVDVAVPASYTWCDDICLLGTLAVAGMTYNWVVEFSLPSVATDVSGATILQASEHINEIPLDIASAFLQYTLAQYTNPAAPTTSALQLTAASLVNVPASGGLTTGQVAELNGLVDQMATVPKIGTTAILTAGDEAALTAAGSGSGALAAMRGAATITIPGTHTTSGSPLVLTHAQYETLLASLAGGDDAATVPVAGGTATETYYLIGQPRIAGNVVMVATVAYNAQGAQVSRTDLYTAPATY